MLNLRKIILFIIFTSFASAALAGIRIGTPNWTSGKAKAYVFKVIIEEKLDRADVEIWQRTNPEIFAGMAEGDVAVHAETWLPSHTNFINAHGSSIAKGAGETAEGGQYMCTTQGTVDRTGLRHIEDLASPTMAQNFDTDGDGKGEVWIGADGWGSTLINMVRAKSYGYDKTMKLKIMEESDAWVELENAVTNDKNIVFYCYRPHHIFASYKNLVILEEPPHDPSTWKIVPSTEEDWLEKSYASSAWQQEEIGVHYATLLWFTDLELAKLFSRATFSTDETSDMSYDLDILGVDPEKFAREWLTINMDRVNSWLQ